MAISGNAPGTSGFSRLKGPGLDAVRWTKGFWADRFELCRNTVIPKMKEALEHADNSARLSNFCVAAGLEEGGHRGVDWSDGDCYKWLEAMARVHAVTREDGLDREMDEWIGLIAKAQDADGYINTQVQLDPAGKRWTFRRRHELYNLGHLFTAASVHYRATGKDSFLAVARRAADCEYRAFAHRPPELAHGAWNPSDIMGLVDLYRVTGEKRYLDLAGVFVDMRGSAPPDRDDPDPGDQTQDRVPLREETQAVGHAVTGTYLWCGAADVYAETGDKGLLDALERIWHDVTERKIYVTGAVGAYHQGISVRYDKVHEAFGRAHELPAATAYNETCANAGNAMWNKRMLDVTGEARFADVMELALYNSVLSGMSLSGDRFCYTNPLARDAGAGMLTHDTAERWQVFSCYCCPPQVARILASVNEWACGVSAEGVWIHLYGGFTLRTTVPGKGRIGLTVKSDYPWDGRVEVKVDEASGAGFRIMLRVPGWVRGARVRVNGKPAARAPAPGAYVPVERAWAPGDTILLDLPMPPRLLAAHPAVEEERNQVAVARGPLVYCLESPDLPKGVEIDDIVVPRGTAFKVRRAAALLGGVTVLEGEARRIPRTAGGGVLYRDVYRGRLGRLRVRLIPYYAWLNRGPSSMRVWLPLDW
jgi:DUF1680 family protein